MTPSREPEATEAYTRASVEAYLRAATDEKARLQEAIAEARKRVARAQMDEHYLISHHAVADPEHVADPAVADAADHDSTEWRIEPAGGSFGATGSPTGTDFSPDPDGASSFDPDSDPPIAQLRMTPGAEDIWRYLDFPSALAHE